MRVASDVKPIEKSCVHPRDSLEDSLIAGVGLGGGM